MLFLQPFTGRRPSARCCRSTNGPVHRAEDSLSKWMSSSLPGDSAYYGRASQAILRSARKPRPSIFRFGAAVDEMPGATSNQSRSPGPNRRTGHRGWGRGAACQLAIASSVTHKVRLPRRRRPASYSAQFVTLNFIFGMWWRRFSLCLLGMDWHGLSGASTLPDWLGIRATTPLSMVFLAKESFFKASFNTVGYFFDFDAITLTRIDPFGTRSGSRYATRCRGYRPAPCIRSISP